MFPTHLIFGFSVLVIYPHIFGFAIQDLFILNCAIASVISDLDLFIGQHRKTLHYPVYSIILFFFTIPIIYVSPIFGVYLNSFLLCFGMHSIFDAIGGGLGKRPWKSDLNLPTVYNHYSNRWMYKHNFKYRLEYDGSPADLLILIILSIWVFIMLDIQYTTYIIISSLFIGSLYTITRKRLVKIEDKLSKYPIFNWYIRTLHGSDIGSEEE